MSESNYARGRDVSGALTEVRTVLSRAETALTALGRDRLEWQRPGWTDPDLTDMQAALAEVVELLDRWRRTGRPTKRG